MTQTTKQTQENGELTVDVLMGAIQAMKDDINRRFKNMATRINKEGGHIDLVDGAVQEHTETIIAFNNNFAIIKEQLDKNTQAIKSLVGETDEEVGNES